MAQFEPAFRARTNLQALQNSKDWQSGGIPGWCSLQNPEDGEVDSQEEGQRLLNPHNLPQWLCCGCPAEEADLFSWQGQILAREETQEDSKHTFQNSRGSHGMGKENPAPVLVSLLMAL